MSNESWIRYAGEQVIDALREHVGEDDGTEPPQREYVDAFDAISDHVWGWLNAQTDPARPPGGDSFLSDSKEKP